MVLWNYIKERMMYHPNQVICENNAEMSYEEIVVFSELFAKKLIGEKCCAIFCGSEMANAMAVLSCFAADVTAVPLSARYGSKHCNKILKLINPTAVITDIGGQLQVLHITDEAYVEPERHPALIMCTSGTTGNPKGVMLSEQNILANVRDISAYFNITQNDIILISRPLYHCAVLTGELIVSLLKGIQIRFCSEKFNPKSLIDLISEKKVTVFCGTPTMINAMTYFMRGKNSCKLRVLVTSGECMSVAVGKKIREYFPDTLIYNVYGQTEAAPRISYLPPEIYSKYPDSVGLHLASLKLKIIKENGENAKTGEEGILWVNGPNIMMGYFNNPEETAKVIKDNWLCTGDIAVIESDGLLRIKGRIDDLIIRGGMNIYPVEIENEIRKDSRVEDVFVYGINNSDIGTQIGMKISGKFTNTDEVKKLCIEVLPSFQIPAKIELLEKLPKNASGKIIRGENND